MAHLGVHASAPVLLVRRAGAAEAPCSRAQQSVECCRRALLLSAALALAAPASAVAAGPDLGPKRNTAVLRALKERKQAGAVSNGSVASRLAGALGQLQRARVLAATGRVRDARGLLREGGAKTVRTDAAAVAVQAGVPQSWDNTLLDAFDDALRVAERGGSAEAVQSTGEELEVALKALLDVAKQGISLEQ